MAFNGTESFFVSDPARAPMGAGENKDIFLGDLSELLTFIDQDFNNFISDDTILPQKIDFSAISQIDANTILSISSQGIGNLSLNSLNDVNTEDFNVALEDILQFDGTDFVPQSLSSRVRDYETDTDIINQNQVGRTIAQYRNESGSVFDIREHNTSISFDRNTRNFTYNAEDQTYVVNLSDSSSISNAPLLP